MTAHSPAVVSYPAVRPTLATTRCRHSANAPTGGWVEDEPLIGDTLGAPRRLCTCCRGSQVAAHVTAHGRTAHGWDEILEGGAPEGALIAAWRGPEAAVRAGHQVVSCPDMWTYLDYRQSDAPDEPVPVGTRLAVEDVDAFDPVPPGLTAVGTCLLRLRWEGVAPQHGQQFLVGADQVGPVAGV